VLVGAAGTQGWGSRLGQQVGAAGTQGMQTTAIERAVTEDSEPRERSSQAGGARIMVQG
jgi:hypothetical protein